MCLWGLLLWCNRISGVLGALGYGFDPQPSTMEILNCHRCSLGQDYGLDLIPGLGAPYAMGQPKNGKSKQASKKGREGGREERRKKERKEGRKVPLTTIGHDM